jgi:PAS domain S-box-containing protein
LIIDVLKSLSSTDGLMLHDRWATTLMWALASTDTLIGLAYISISITLYSLVKKIRIPFHAVFLAFGLFIFACGATHFIEVYTLWVPSYWLAAFTKIVTAIASVATAISLIILKPKFIKFANASRLTEEQLKISRDQILEDLRTKELEFQTLVNSLPQLAWMAHPNGSIFWCNDEWYDYTGSTPEMTLGSGWQNLHDPKELPKILADWNKIIAGGEPDEMEVRIRGKNGESRWFLTRLRPIKNARGEITRWIGTDTDIDEQKHFQSELQSAVRARDEFLSIASHELKTPITSLKLQLQMTQRAVLPEKAGSPVAEKLSQFLDVSARQVLRLEGLIEELLDVAKIRSGKLTLLAEEVNLAHLVREVVERLDGQIKQAKCEISLELDDHIVGLWDYSRIEQIIINLLSNAIKYAPGKPIEIMATQKDEFARLSIRDYGQGIELEKQKLIFERFERVTSSRNISGLGLGLFIVKQIVEGHLGTVKVNSARGQGSTFVVSLPLMPLFLPEVGIVLPDQQRTNKTEEL